MITHMIDMVRELPMETKRHMLANMMFVVPMAAATMAAAGLPSLAIAPLATVIPGFLFMAFMDASPEGGHGHGHHGAHTSDGGTTVRPPRRGIAGLVSALREFHTNRRQNQTLHIQTDPEHGHHHG